VTAPLVPGRLRAPLAAGAVIGGGLLLALAATIDPRAPAAGGAGASLVIRLPDGVRAVVFTLLALSGVVLAVLLRPQRGGGGPFLERYRELQRRSWMSVLTLPILVFAFALAYQAWSRWAAAEGHRPEAPFAVIADLLAMLASARKPEASAPFLDLAVATLAVVAALGTFALILAVAMAERLDAWLHGRAAVARGAAIESAVVDSLEDLRAEADPRRAIVRAWRRFEQALVDVRAPRAPWQTPSELMRSTLARLPVPPAPLERLTRLFEAARFSDRPLGPDARDAACDCLEDVQAALAAHAAARDAAAAGHAGARR
jgi:hypothetical protein